MLPAFSIRRCFTSFLTSKLRQALVLPHNSVKRLMGNTHTRSLPSHESKFFIYSPKSACSFPSSLVTEASNFLTDYSKGKEALIVPFGKCILAINRWNGWNSQHPDQQSYNRFNVRLQFLQLNLLVPPNNYRGTTNFTSDSSGIVQLPSSGKPINSIHKRLPTNARKIRSPAFRHNPN